MRNGIAMNGPGGSGLVEVTSSTLRENSRLEVNHHCALAGEVTGGMCASHYLFTALDLDHDLYVVDGAAGHSDVLVLLDGATRMRANANAAFDTGACYDPHDDGVWMDCPVALQVRWIPPLC